MLNPAKAVARALLGSVFVGGSLNQLKMPEMIGPLVDGAKEQYGIDIPFEGEDLVKLNGAGMLLAGTGLALGVSPRACALALMGLLAPTTLVGHQFWTKTDPQEKMHDMAAFMANAGIMGGLLMVVLDND